MTPEDGLQLLFWVFTPAYMLVAGVLVRNIWRSGIAKGDQRFPWYWAIVAAAYYLVIAIASHGRGLLWPPVIQLFVMSLMTAGILFMAAHILWGWWKARRAKSETPE